MTYREPPGQAGTQIAAALDVELAPVRHQRVDAGDELRVQTQRPYVIESHEARIAILGAWKIKSWNWGSGVALLAAPSDDDVPKFSTLSAAVERMLAERIGYVKLWKPLALNLVWCGHGVLDRAGNLNTPMELASTPMRGVPGMLGMERKASDRHVNLVSITIVDLAAKRVVADRHERASRSRPVFEAIQKAVRSAL